jgi:F0F1-type ATP synthase assembly protein I
MLKEQDKKTETSNTFSALSLAFELGYIIAIPIVGFALGGRLLDHKFDSSPIFLLLGIFVSILLSSYLVYKKTQKIIQET